MQARADVAVTAMPGSGGERPVTLRDGSRIRIRPIAPGDRAELVAGFERLSAESRFRRFFSPVQQLSERQLDYLTQVDHHDHEALVALEDETGTGVAVARFVRTDAEHAEPAVAVADDWQGRGLGTLLLEALADRAREEGISSFRAPVLATNARALALVQAAGGAVERHDGGEVVVEVPLAEPAGARDGLLDLLRAFASGLLRPGHALLGGRTGSPRSPQTVPLNVLDELHLHLDRPTEPWNLHIEARVEGRIDAGRLREAVMRGVASHPLARARLAPPRALELHRRWEIREALDEVPLRVRECADDAALAAAREELLSTSPSLECAPPFALTLAHHPGGDALILNLHHAAGDGVSALRLLVAILRAYAGEADPAAPVDPLAVRDIGDLVGSRSVKTRVKRARAAARYVGRVSAPPTRMAPDGGSVRGGYGVALLELEPDEVARVLARRPAGATVDDVLLGALAVAIRRWDDARGAGSGSIHLTMPVNLRPAEWRSEVVGNFTSYVTVHLEESAQTELDAATAAAAAGTRMIERDGVAALIVDLLEQSTTLPRAVTERLQRLIPLTGNLAVETAALSNLGRVGELPALGAAGAVRALWFSPPGRMPLGASLGVATHEERLFVALRHRHALLGGAAAATFAESYREVLLARTPSP